MLLITRRSGEAIVINGTIEVKVLEVKGGRVKLGFEYPPGSSVFRQELFAKIQAENQAAAASKQPADPSRLTVMVRNLHSAGGKGGNAPQTETTTEKSKAPTNARKPNPTSSSEH